jgi:hypothetical protein
LSLQRVNVKNTTTNNNCDHHGLNLTRPAPATQEQETSFCHEMHEYQKDKASRAAAV